MGPSSSVSTRRAEGAIRLGLSIARAAASVPTCARINQNDLMALAGDVQQEVRWLTPLGLQKVVVDTTGLGAGLYDRLN